MEVLDILSSEVGKYGLVGWRLFFFCGLLIQLLQASPRGVDLIDITSPGVGIVKLWVGELLTFFMSVYNSIII